MTTECVSINYDNNLNRMKKLLPDLCNQGLDDNGKIINIELFMQERTDVKGKLLYIELYHDNLSSHGDLKSPVLKMLSKLGKKWGNPKVNSKNQNRLNYSLDKINIFLCIKKSNTDRVLNIIKKMIKNNPKTKCRYTIVSIENNNYACREYNVESKAFKGIKLYNNKDEISEKHRESIINNYLYTYLLTKDSYKIM